MPARANLARRRGLRIAGAAAVALAITWRLRGPLAQVGALAIGASAVAFAAAPLARLFERRLSRPLAALAGLSAIALALAGLLALLLPAMFREFAGLSASLPRTLSQASAIINRAFAWMESRLPGLSLPAVDSSGAARMLSRVASGSFRVAVNLADVAARTSLMIVLAYFLLRDRDDLLLRLEQLLPQAARHKAVRIGGAVCRELRLYLRGQLLIAGTVAALSAAGLALVGVRGALVLGPFVGLMNVIPYFGPYIGGIPAVLIALGDGWRRAALAILVLAAVQQLDGSVISPRVLGSVTGLSPALVLVGVYAGARLAGIGGMLLALPAMMAARTVYRVFIQKA